MPPKSSPVPEQYGRSCSPREADRRSPSTRQRAAAPSSRRRRPLTPRHVVEPHLVAFQAFDAFLALVEVRDLRRRLAVRRLVLLLGLLALARLRRDQRLGV